MRQPTRQAPDLSRLLEHARLIPVVPKPVRARLLARARATATAEVPHERELNERELIVEPSRRIPVVAWLAAAALIVSAAGAVMVARSGAKDERPAAPLPSVHVVSLLPAAPAPAVMLPAAAVSAPVPEQALRRPVPGSVTVQESYATELRLLRRAQSAFAQRDFTKALTVIAEHTRNFPSGRLSEEREALRIQSLAGSGRADEARHATSAFAKRFPRSVLLPRLQQLTGTN
jgi:hypothetical protein